MSKLHLKFQQLKKQITIPQKISSKDFSKLLSLTFKLNSKVIGLTDLQGKFYDIEFITKNLSIFQNAVYCLVTSKDLDNNLSFAQQENIEFNARETLPPISEKGCLGIIGDIQIFQQLCLEDNIYTIVKSFIKNKPDNAANYGYYLYHDLKNSAMIYRGNKRLCELFVDDWKVDCKRISEQIQFIISEGQTREEEKPNPRKKNLLQNGNNHNYRKQKIPDDRETDRHENDEIAFEQQFFPEQNQHKQHGFEHQNGEFLQANGQLPFDSDTEQPQKQTEAHTTLIDKLHSLYKDDLLTEIEYYKLKAGIIENINSRHQIQGRKGKRNQYGRRREEVGSKHCARRDENIRTDQHARRTEEYSHKKLYKKSQKDHIGGHKGKSYEIPIIVRKYNNVIENITTSYPLTFEQEQAINVVLELELKGLISQRDSGIFKSMILQEEHNLFQLFSEYFYGSIDQIDLSNKLKAFKHQNKYKPYSPSDRHSSGHESSKQYSMRLLIRHSRQNNYELLRKLLMDSNHHVVQAINRYKNDKNSEMLMQRLEKVAKYYRVKEQLQKSEL